jgi:hypothetical protein
LGGGGFRRAGRKKLCGFFSTAGRRSTFAKVIAKNAFRNGGRKTAKAGLEWFWASLSGSSISTREDSTIEEMHRKADAIAFALSQNRQEMPGFAGSPAQNHSISCHFGNYFWQSL